MATKKIEIITPGSEIEYQEGPIAAIGKVIDVEVRMNPFGTDILYNVSDSLDKEIFVDGTTFQKI